MFSKFHTIKNNTSFHILILICLSFFTCLKAKWAYEAFTESNIPVYDGVMYQYHQIKRYESFQGDFSWINHYSQAVYEFQGHYVTAAYNSFITFFCPSLLKNDLDIFIRGILTLLIFSFSAYVYFREKIGKLKTVVIIGIILQMPFFTHYRTGINTYIPELSCALLIISGYLLILHFFSTFQFKHFAVGLILMISTIGIRFNFFSYVFLLGLPLLFIYIKNWNNYSSKLKKLTLIYTIIILIFTGSYILYFYTPFYTYYTKTAYAYSTISLSFSTMLQDFWTYFSWEGYIILALIILVKKTIAIENSWKYNFLILYPFLIFFIFIILILKTENIPHIISVMAFFFSMSAFLISPINKLKINSKFTSILVIFLLGLINYSFLKSIDKNKNIEQYQVQNTLISFFTHKIQSNKAETPNYLCFFEGMTEIPINVAIYQKTNKLITNKEFFFNQDVFYKNGLNCQNSSECFAYYKKNIGDIDYIIINSKPPIINLFPIARKLNIKMLTYLKTCSEFKVIKKIKSTYYGEIIIYQRIKK